MSTSSEKNPRGLRPGESIVRYVGADGTERAIFGVLLPHQDALDVAVRRHSGVHRIPRSRLISITTPTADDATAGADP